MSPERSVSGSSPAAGLKRQTIYCFLVGLRIDHVAAGLGRDDPLAEEQLQVALLHAVDLLQRGFQAFAEDILPRFARDQLDAVAAQREDLRGGGARGVLQRGRRHVGLVRLQARELVFGGGVRQQAGRCRSRSRGFEVGVAVEQGDLRPGDAPRRLVGERSAHPEEFLRITRIGTAQRHVVPDGDINGEDRAGLGDGEAAGGFVRALKGDVWVLGRDAAREQHG